MSKRRSRRTFLKRLGGLSIAGLAGCNSRPEDPPTGTRTATPTPTPTATATGTPTESPTRTEAYFDRRPEKLRRVSELGSGITGGIFTDVAVSGDSAIYAGVVSGNVAVVSFDSALEVEWVREFPELEPSETYGTLPAVSVASTTDGGLLLTAAARDTRDTFVCRRLDSVGDTEWGRSFEADLLAGAKAVQLADGSYSVAWAEVGANIRWTGIIAFDGPDADTRWKTRYKTLSPTRFEPTPAGGCFVFGAGLRTGSWMAILDSHGEEQWRFNRHDYVFGSPWRLGESYYLLGTDDGSLQVRQLAPDRSVRWTHSYDVPDRALVNWPVYDAIADAGTVQFFLSGEEVFTTVRLDTEGEMLSQRSYGIARNEKSVPTAVAEVSSSVMVSGLVNPEDFSPRFGESRDGEGWVAVV